MEIVQIPTLSFDRFVPVIGRTGAERLRHTVGDARALLDGRVIWHVNSTASGGGVAEMLQTFLGYERGAGIDARWLVIEGNAEFFTLTKRIHHNLHGRDGDGRGYSAGDEDLYDEVMQRNARKLLSHVRAGDVVVLHDPQTAGLTTALKRAGAFVVWRCHVGCDQVNAIVRRVWRFLEPRLESADCFVFSRSEYVPTWLRGGPTYIVPPAIDAFSAKNVPISRGSVRAILHRIGLLAHGSTNGELDFTRTNGSSGRVERKAVIFQTAPIPSWRVPVITQVSRWDPLKDMQGVMRGFAVRLDAMDGAHLVLAGPDVSGVTDDPEGVRVWEECVALWRDLPQHTQDRVHLASLPMDDVEENAMMVNALQRHASVVVQKSLEEGFGLTVTEAMWKGRAVVASAVGGIQDQISDGTHGLLLDDPTDLTAFSHALELLLHDHALVRRLGRNARRRAIAKYLAPRRLAQLVDAIYAMEGRARETAAA
jgi:trehalose synthase